jgi:hypothetical protein
MSSHNWSNKNIIVEDTSGYLENLDYDLVEEARGKKITDPIRAKLMGMEDIRDLKGTMTPRYFATKVIRFLQKENPELDLENLSNDDIQNAINVVANVSKPLAQRSDITITTRERGAAKEGLKKGDTGFETLQLNLGDDTTLKSEGEVGSNDLYTVVSDGLKYRVTLNSFKGTKINLDDISQDDVVSVVIVKPSEVETVDKFAGEIDLGQREKLVADFPEGEEYGDEDAEIDHDKADLDDDGELSEYEKARGQAIADAMEKDEEDAESCSMSDEENNPKQVHPLDKDLDDDGEIKDYEKARESEVGKMMKKEQERAGQAHARAVADYYEDENNNQKEIEDERKAKDKERQQEIEAETRASRGEEDAERCPVTGKLRKKSDEESCDEEEEQEIAMSQQQINQFLVNQHRLRMQNFYSQERMNRHGY